MLKLLSEPAKKLLSRLLSGEVIWVDEVNEATCLDLYLSGAIKIQADQIVIRNRLYEKAFLKNVSTTLSRKRTPQEGSDEVVVGQGIPQIGSMFLEPSDRLRIANIVRAVIAGRSEMGIKILLANCHVSESLINQINYNQAVHNIAEDIVGMLETRGSSDIPNCHSLGAFLVELENEVGHDAKFEISSFIAKYKLIQ